MKQFDHDTTIGKKLQLKLKQSHEHSFDYWQATHNYYHQRVIDYFKKYIPKEAAILHVGSKNGYLLEALTASAGVGIEENIKDLEIAQNRYKQYNFFSTLAQVPETYTFDYIILSFATMKVDDVQSLLEQLHIHVHHRSRIIVETYPYHWAPILRLTELLGLRRQTQYKNWISRKDLHNFLYLAGFDVVSNSAHTLLPVNIPLLSWLCNKIIVQLPFISRLCLHHIVTARPQLSHNAHDRAISVIVPCKNEQGTIEQIVQTIPNMGKSTEIIFIEGHSTDNTAQEIERTMKAYPDKKISFYTQPGKGKADAVREGFKYAQGDILMILDADLTIKAHELTKCFDALINTKAEFVNGSRLVYGQQANAMMPIAYIANLFFGWLISYILGQRVKDTLCGTKVLWKSDYQLIAAYRHTLGIHDPFGDFDLLFGAAKLQLKIVDIPMRYYPRTYGQTNIQRCKDVWFLLYMCWRAWRTFHII